MRGLLADVNVQGHLPYLRQRLENLEVWSVMAELKLEFVTFRDLTLDRRLDDRSLWNYCQQEHWILFTENRKAGTPDSLQATITDSWKTGSLPVLTLASKRKFEHNPSYAHQVATDIAELLFDIVQGQSCDEPRIYVPRSTLIEPLK
jgi:hypothetical protein